MKQAAGRFGVCAWALSALLNPAANGAGEPHVAGGRPSAEKKAVVWRNILLDKRAIFRLLY